VTIGDATAKKRKKERKKIKTRPTAVKQWPATIKKLGMTVCAAEPIRINKQMDM